MRRLLMSVIVLAGAGLGAWFARPFLFGPGTGARPEAGATASLAQPAAGQPPARRTVLALGTLEPEDGVVQIGSRLVGYRIVSVEVQEGDVVASGDLLAQIDSSTAEAQRALVNAQLDEARERQRVEIEAAREQVAGAELALEQVITGRPLELEAQQALVDVAESKAQQAEQELSRLTELRQLPEPLAPQSLVEQQRLLLDAARAEVIAAQLGLRRLEQSLTFQQQKAEAELRAARQSLEFAEKGAGIRSLEQQLEIAELQLAETRVVARGPGVVLTVAAHAGEVVAQQPLFQVADLEQLVCTAEVEATDVTQIQPQQAARIQARAFHDVVLRGTVTRIGSLVAQAQLRPLDPRAPLDRSVVKVVIDIPPEELARLAESFPAERRSALVGLQAEVELPPP